jgi:putative transport protein
MASVRKEGLRLNLLAAGVIVLGALLAVVVVTLGRFSHVATSGLFAGAFTNTPALAAGQVLLGQITQHDPARANAILATTGLAYAVTYPFGLIGPTLAIVLLRKLLRIRMDDERSALSAGEVRPSTLIVDVEVLNERIAGSLVRDLTELRGKRVVISRLYRGGEVSVPRGDTVLQTKDVCRIVGHPPDVESVVAAFGKPSKLDLGSIAGSVRRVDILVTKPSVLHRTLSSLNFPVRAGVTIGRVVRAGVDIIPNGALTLKFGDVVSAVGPADGLKLLEEELGNEQDALNRPQLLPIFLGIVLGVLVGAIPFHVPGLSTPFEIGLAGGPLIAAIALSQLGSIGSVVWYMPPPANQLIRDLGLAVFLACVGFTCGDHFVQRTFDGGVAFIVAGAAITLLPTLIGGLVARLVFKMNFITLSGWLAGTMTNTPALIFSSDDSRSDAPALAYASVAPLCLILPIFCAKGLALALGG